MTTRKRYLAIVGLIVFIAFAVRLWNLGTQSLWHDEAWSIFSAYHPLDWSATGTDPNTPPVFYLLLGAWMQAAGDGVWALRYASLMIGVLTVAATAFVVRRWFGDRAAIMAAFLVAASPMLWVFSQEIRAYIAVPLVALILLVLLDRLLRSPDRRAWAWLLAAEWLALYTHNLAVPLAAWLNVVALAAWARRRDRRRIGIWLLAQAGVGLAYLPWLLTQRPTGSPLNTPPVISPVLAWEIWQSYFTGIQALLNADPLLVALIAAFGGLGLIAVIGALAWRRSARLVLIASQALLVPACELAIIQAAHIDFHPRYFIAGVPASLILIAVGLDAIREHLKKLPDPVSRVGGKTPQGRGFKNGRLVFAAAMLLAATIAGQALRLTAGNAGYQHDDFRAMAERYTALTSDDAIVVPYGWEPTLAYYADKLGIRAPIVGIPAGSTWQTIADRLNALHARRVEVLTWYQAPADLRGVYSCLLGAVNAAPPDSFTVNGLTSAGYDRPARIETRSLAASPVSFEMFETTHTQVAAGNRRACVISDWTLLNPSSATARESMRVTAGLFNPPGWMFTRDDADLRDDHQMPTQFWAPGQRGSAFTLLEYPPGTPAGDYPLAIGLYGAESLRGLSVTRDGAPAGQTAMLGTLAISPSPPDEAALAAFTFAPVANGLSVALTDNPADGSCALQPGQQLRVSALWRTDGRAAHTAVIRLSGTDWRLEAQTPIAAGEAARLTWHAFSIPAQANGQATLGATASDGSAQHLRTCAITPADHLFNPPAMTHPLGVTFPGVGTLAGFDLPDAEVSRTGAFTLTLYWKADATPQIAYTVFTHLLDSQGRVIAQDDSPPAAGHRLTTGWVAGEYVTDAHLLQFNEQGHAYTGTATIEAGLYDPASGARVLVSDGADHMLLPVSLTVTGD